MVQLQSDGVEMKAGLSGSEASRFILAAISGLQYLSNTSGCGHSCAEKEERQGDLCVGSVPGGSLWAAWGVTDSPGAPGQLWSSQWASDGGISAGIPQALLSKMSAGPPAPP